ncbi:MAG TPA: DinB family protein [Bryobacteraceae bacterium]|jgi:hypothetical protein
MSVASPGRPAPSEFSPHAKGYVDLVPDDDLIVTLERQPRETVLMLKPVDEASAGTVTYEPGKWSIKQIVGHVSDAERIFATRILRIARADRTPLPGFEQDDYVASAGSNQRTLADLLAEYESVRNATLTLLRSLTPDAWLRVGSANNHDQSVRGVAYTLAGHELHHVKILRERYLPLLNRAGEVGLALTGQ